MKAVREAVLKVEGVTEADVSLREKTARVTAHKSITPDAVKQAIESAGEYRAELVKNE